MTCQLTPIYLCIIIGLVLVKAITIQQTTLCTGPHCEAQAKEYLDHTYEAAASQEYNKVVLADWDYNTDVLNKTAEDNSKKANIALAEFILKEYEDNIKQYDWESFSDSSSVKRQLKFLNGIGTAALKGEDLEKYNNVLADMNKIYATATVCPFDDQTCEDEKRLPLEPDLEHIIATSTNYDELTYIWKGWRESSGKKVRELYSEYVNYGNKAALANGYPNLGQFWIRTYESKTFQDDIEKLWLDVKDLYEELHAYVRFRLIAKFPANVVDGEPIPASVLGNMWAQSWDNIFPDVVPFPDAPIFDVTPALKKRFNQTHEGISQIFEVANEFFVSLGLEDMAMSYGPKAMIIRPEDKEVLCHASAWDFYNGYDYRIKMCTSVNMEDFITVHHELGHIQYFLNYRNLPIAFREGANPGFHEAIGDVVALSVATPKHMIKLGYLEGTPPSKESTINYLMKMALDKIAFLPFGYLIDAYRWKIFDGTIPTTQYTYDWIKMRSDYQGIVPPVIRSEDDFDAGAKFHVPGNTPYIRYFVSFILQFQIHQALCLEAGQYEKGNASLPLHECDIYQNAAAGKKFKAILQSGMSKTWEDLLFETIGERKMSAEPIKEYFSLLTDYLKEQRAKENYMLGWNVERYKDYYQAPTTH